MKFRFRLEAVLNLRKLHQQQAQQRYADALHAVDLIDQRIAGIEAERQASREFSRPSIGPIKVEMLLDGGRYELQLQADIAQLRQQKEQVLQEVERRREALRAADGQVKQVERLRESARRQHRMELRHLEQLELDEFASQAFARRDDGHLSIEPSSEEPNP